MAEIALSVRCVKRLKPFTGQCSVQECQRPWPFGALINCVAWIHQETDDASECFGWRSWGGLRFGKNLAQRFCHPIPTCRPVVTILGVTILEELGDVAAASVSEESL